MLMIDTFDKGTPAPYHYTNNNRVQIRVQLLKALISNEIRTALACNYRGYKVKDKNFKAVLWGGQ